MNIQGVNLVGGNIRDYNPSLVVKDIVTAGTLSSTNLTPTGSIRQTYSDGALSAGCMVLPSSPTVGQFTVALATNKYYTIDYWKYITAASGSFDIMWQLQSLGGYIYQSYRGDLAGTDGSTGSGWGDGTGDPALNTWVHYFFFWTSTSVGWGRNGIVRTTSYTPTGIIASLRSATITSLSFKDNQFGGYAKGYMGDIRISEGDVLGVNGLADGASYTIPTLQFGVTTSTRYLFRAA